ncbi:unconventional myosin-XV-like [Acanthaster planci]|uniref:Unconventional myosin-XV-like n=1 Tax=Acanthaster planci TaxID=133434 RepID=A0A8B7YLS3_ACAPL|nr:unconventional myosin-XV-like [Acanthaster planci]
MELGTPVWFDAGGDYPLPGRVTETYGGDTKGVKVQCVLDEKMYTVANPQERIRIRHDALEIQHIDDMIQLRDLHEGSILFNLKTRYDKGLIYTYTGSILVAVNPYKLFDIYGIDTVKKYEGKPLGHLLPHLFAMGNSAYMRMMQTDKNQCVIISGESGAGKTESTKLIMQYLAAVNKAPSNLTTEQILEANPLLESFGNAKTVRNDNSSRFGKYTEVFFKKGIINGAKTTDYLLEKSRIVHQGPEERNYHVFYELLAGLSSPEAAKYGLRTAERYHFLNQGGSCRIEGKDDGEDFYRLVSAMEVLRFSPSEQEVIFGILAAILHLGNVKMNVGQNDYLVIQNENELNLAAKFLHLRLEELERAITFRLTETRGERILTPRTLQQAIEARDGIAKSVYSSLFSWLVKSINTIVGNVGTMTSIAILDIFGFEVFQTNSFEQMCINYANEHLQFFFNKHIFMLEQQEYLKEKIPWTSIEFKDNQKCIDMIGKRPFGIIHILDDESSFPNSSDKSFMDKCHYQHMGNTHYSRARVSSLQFNIKHFAGPVTYDIEGFLEKNRDMLKPEVVNMFINSQSQLISDIFVSLRRQEEQKAMMMSSVRGDNSMRKMRASTVATRFNESLLDLIGTMTKCNPFFVRCIKPNNYKSPMEFDDELVLEQLRYSGMLETISIRKMGFPIRMGFKHFANRYRFLMDPVALRSTIKETCRTILAKADQSDGKDYVIGTSKVFMRESLETSLEHQRSRVIRHAAVTIQKWVRRHHAQRRYRRQREAVILIQAQVKGRRERTRYVKARRGMILLQAVHRGRRQRRRYLEMLAHHKKMLAERARLDAEERERLQADAILLAQEEERLAKRANITLLEMPMDLALCMEKLADWSNPHSERNLNKTVGQVAHQDYVFSFPLDVDEYPLSKYIQIYFKTPHFGAAIEPINTGFHKLNEMEDQDAVSTFKLILRFTLEKGLSKDKEMLIGNYIVQKGISNRALRDEIYSQLCNQTWKAPEALAEERAWLLMANLMSVCPPSKRFYKYLLKYVSDHAYDGYKSYCHQKLLLCDTQALEFLIPRTYPPCFLEWKANRQRCNMALVAELADGEEVTVMADSWSTGEDFAKSALQKKGITKGCYGWSVYMVEDKTRSELSGFDYIMDLISEIEIPPEFPVRESQFLVSSETVQDRFPQRKLKVVRNNLAQIDALLEMDPAALNANIPPPPSGAPPPVPASKASPSKLHIPSSAPPPSASGASPGVDLRQKRPSTSSRPRSGEVEYSTSFLNPREELPRPVFPGNIHIPEPDYDLPPEEDQRNNEYDDTVVHPSSPIHPTLNSDASDSESDHNHYVGQRIRNVSVPRSESRNRLDDYVDRLFNPVLEMNGGADLANAAKLNKALRGGGRGPTPTPTPVFVPPPPPLATGLPASSVPMPGEPHQSPVAPVNLPPTGPGPNTPPNIPAPPPPPPIPNLRFPPPRTPAAANQPPNIPAPPQPAAIPKSRPPPPGNPANASPSPNIPAPPPPPPIPKSNSTPLSNPVNGNLSPKIPLPSIQSSGVPKPATPAPKGLVPVLTSSQPSPVNPASVNLTTNPAPVKPAPKPASVIPTPNPAPNPVPVIPTPKSARVNPAPESGSINPASKAGSMNPVPNPANINSAPVNPAPNPAPLNSMLGSLAPTLSTPVTLATSYQVPISHYSAPLNQASFVYPTSTINQGATFPPLTPGFANIQGTPMQTFPPTAVPSATGLPSVATTPAYTPGILTQPTLPTVPAVQSVPPVLPLGVPAAVPPAMPATMPLTVPTPVVVPQQPSLLEAAIQQQQAAQHMAAQQAAVQQAAAQQAAAQQAVAQQAIAQQVAAQQAAAQQAAAQQAAAQQAAAQQAAAQQAAAQQAAAQQAAAQQAAAQQAAAQQAAAQQAAAQQAAAAAAVHQQQQRQQQEALLQQQAVMNQQTIVAQQMQLQQQQQMIQDMQSKLSTAAPTPAPSSLKSSLTKSHDAQDRSSSVGSPPLSPLKKKILHFSSKVVDIPRESFDGATTSEMKPDSPMQAPPIPPVKSPKPGSVPPPPPLPPPPPSPPSDSNGARVRTRNGKVVPLKDSYRADTVRIGRVVWPPRKEEEHRSSGVQIDWDKDAVAADAGQLDEDIISRNYQPTSEIKKAIQAAHNSKGAPQEASLETLISARARRLQGKFDDSTPKPMPPLPPPPLKSALKAPPPARQKKLSPQPSPSKLKMEDVHAEAMAKIRARKATLERQSPKGLPPVTKAPPPPVTPSSSPTRAPPAPPIPPAAPITPASPGPIVPPPPPPPISTIPSIRAKAEAFQQSQPVTRSESKRDVPKRILPKKQEAHNEAMHILKSHGHRVRTNTDHWQAFQHFKISDKTMDEVVVPLMSSEDMEKLESPHTKAFASIPDVFYTYNRVRWHLHIRKEVFTPGERLDNPMAQQLVFYQIVTDTFSKSCIRMSMEEKRQVRAVLDTHGVNPQNAAQKTKMRKDVIELVRKFPIYFSRFFPVTGGRKNPRVEILGVSENGISLVKREYDQTKDQLTLLDHFSFSDIKQIEVTAVGTIKITLTNDRVISLFTYRAQLIKSMIEAYIIDLERDSQYVRAIQDYITRESTLLSFRKGDIIKLNNKHPAAGSDWLFGMLDGRTGFFPKESVIPAPGPESRNLLVRRGIAADLVISAQEEPKRQKQGELPPSPAKPQERQPTQEEMTRFSMVEFASKYFREYPNKYVMQRKEDGSIRGSLKFMGNFKRSRKKNSKKKPDPVEDVQDYSQYLDAVSFTNSPIQASLLEFPQLAINKLALECFVALMQVMGDYPLNTKQDVPLQQALYEKVVFILKACFSHREICDEVYCHVIKQTTRNTSSKKLSQLHGWRFFVLLTAIFQCSPTLKPYLFQYLSMVTQTAEFQYGGIAGVCLFNLRKTFRHGGRRLLPGPEEVENLLAGRMVRRQQIHLPGNMRTMVKVSTSSVVLDLLEELCTEMGIQQPAVIEEFGLFGLVPQKNKVVPLQLSDYMMDVTTHFDNQDFEYAFLFKKVVWYQPMSVSNEFASAIIYNQVLPNYQNGHLVILEFNTLTEQQKTKIVRLAVLMHRAADKVQIPTMKDLPNLVPAGVINHMTNQQWLNLIHGELPLLESMSPHMARTEFINTIMKWRLFGSTFFDVVHVSDSRVGGGCLLAVNRRGVHFLHPQSHETLVSHGFDEVVSSRYLKGNDGRQYVDLKCGNLMVQKVTRIQTNQCTEIINVIGQHIQSEIAAKSQQNQSDNIADFNNIRSPTYPPSQGQESPNNPAKRWGGVAMPIQSANVIRSPSALSDRNRAASPRREPERRPSPTSSFDDATVPETRPLSWRQQESPSPSDGPTHNRVRQLDSNWLLAPKGAERGHARVPSWDRSTGSARDSLEGDPPPRSPVAPLSSESILKMGIPRSATSRQTANKGAPTAKNGAISNGNIRSNRMGRGAVPGVYSGRK